MVGLNIKNDRVHDLARTAARRTGRSQTGAIELALERLIEALDEHAGDVHVTRRAELDGILADIHEHLTDEGRARMSQAEESLYDQRTGLPA